MPMPISSISPTSATCAFAPMPACPSLTLRAPLGLPASLVRLASGVLLARPENRVERDGEEQDAARDDVDDALRQVERVEAVRDRGDHERAEEGVAHLAATPEEAAAPDHGRCDRIDQKRAATRIEVDAVQARGEHDAADAGHAARDHEDDDPDASDVDARSPRGLRVASNGVYMSAEGRPLRDERPEDEEPDDHQQHERNAAVLVADPDDDECDDDDSGGLEPEEPRVTHGDAVAPTLNHAGNRCRKIDPRDDER